MESRRRMPITGQDRPASHKPVGSSLGSETNAAEFGWAGTAGVNAWAADLIQGLFEIHGDAFGLDTRPLSLAEGLAYILPADQTRVLASYKVARESGGVFETAFRLNPSLRTPDKAGKWVVARGAIETDAEGQATQIRGVAFETALVTEGAPGGELASGPREGSVAAERDAYPFDRQGELLETLLNTLPVLLTIYDPQQKQLHINPEFTRVLGWTQEEVNRGGFMERCYPTAAVREQAREFMAALTPGWRDFPVATSTGGVAEISWANIRLSDERTVGIGMDLREHFEAERVLRESQARLKLAIDAMELGTFDYDPVRGTVACSDRTRAVFGVRAGAPVDMDTLWGTIPKTDASDVRAAFRTALKSGGRFMVEYRAVGVEDGVERWLASWGRVLADAAGKPIAVTGLVADISARKRAVEALFQARARQEILTEVVGRLLNSHDPQDIIAELVNRVMTAAGADESTSYLWDERAGELRWNPSNGAGSQRQAERQPTPVCGVCAQVAKEGRGRLYENIGLSDDPLAVTLRERGLSAYCCYPLLSDGRVLGTLAFGSRTREAFAPEDHAFMQAVANHLAVALERHRDRNALVESEGRYLTIARNIPMGGVWVVDKDLRFQAVEGHLAARFRPLGGFQRGELLDETAANGQASRVAARFRKALAGEVTSMETEYRGFSLWTHYVPIYDHAGGVTGALALALDIGDRKEAEKALRESERRERRRAAELEAIMDAVPAATWVAHDAECSQITSNRFGNEILGLPPESNVSRSTEGARERRPFRVLQNGQEVQAGQLPVQLAARTGTPVRDTELEVRFETGTSRFLFGNAVPLLDADRKSRGAVGAFIDVTDRRRIEEQLRQAAKMESIGVLAGGVAHDFNNLLTGVLGNASLALMDAPPRVAQKLARITEAAEKAAVLTRQLLAYAGKGQFMISDVDLAQVVKSASEVLRISMPKNLELDLGGVPRRLPSVRADDAQLQQVVMNLIANAAESIGGSQPGRVTVTAGTYIHRSSAPGSLEIPASLPAGSFVYVSVADTGCGMSDEEKGKIFDPFYTTKFTGRGLGLAAVQGILRSLAGTISVRSTPGSGSVFTVFLPCFDLDAESSRQVAPAHSPIRGRATVVMADDEPLVRDLGKRALEKFGYCVLLANNGREAIELIERFPRVDLVLLDVIMPVMGGLEAFAQIRHRWPEVAVLMTSGFDRQEASALGPLQSELAFIQKPYTVQQLAAAVRGALEKGRP